MAEQVGFEPTRRLPDLMVFKTILLTNLSTAPYLELPVRLELTTYCLQGNCSTYWAMEAYIGDTRGSWTHHSKIENLVSWPLDDGVMFGAWGGYRTHILWIFSPTLRPHKLPKHIWWRWWDLNSILQPWKGCVLTFRRQRHMVLLKGFEPSTYALEEHYSIQLSYRSMKKDHFYHSLNSKNSLEKYLFTLMKL